ncbi:MAG TPA: HlyD family efflux transporter periplasmic adaptor subunit [Burkholderiaceae bacterium]
MAMIAIVLGGCDSAPGGERTAAVASASGAVLTQEPELSDGLGIRAACILMPQHAVRLKSQVGGELEAVHVKVGDVVHAGQLLAQVNTRERHVQLDRLGIEAQRLEARLRLLTLQLTHAEQTAAAVAELYSPTAQTLNKELLALQEKRLERSDAELQLKDVKLQMDQLNEALRQAEIRSPLQGQVLVRNAEVGAVVGSAVSGLGGGDVLFEVADPLELKADCGLAEADARRLVLGTQMRLIIDGRKDIEFPVRVTQIAPSVVAQGAGSRLGFEADFVAKSGQGVLPGMHATGVLVPEPEAPSH